MRTHERTQARALERTPNPLWAINVGMGAFFLIVAALMAAGF